MRKNISLLLITSLFFSCNKLSDFFPIIPAPQFNKVYGGSIYEAARSIVSSFDGGYVFAGYTDSNDGDVSGNHGSADAWVVKLDKDGKIIWQKTLGGSSVDQTLSITRALDGTYIIAGYTQSNDGDVSGNHGKIDTWVIKLDKDGNLLWQKTFGGSQDDFPLYITATFDGGYVFAGYTDSNDGDVSGNHGNDDAWVVQLDGNGNKLWQKTFGGSNIDNALSVTATLDGGYVMAGWTFSNDGDISGNHGSKYLGEAWVVTIKDK